MKCYIYYNCNWDDIKRIQERFRLPECVNVNGETCHEVDVADEDVQLLRETERRGYIQIRKKK